jgi:hypothetical protein
MLLRQDRAARRHPADPADPGTFVVDGHNTRALADRLDVPTLQIQEVNATTVKGARAAGAISNISSGRGTPFDAAKFARSANLKTLDDVQAAGIPLKGETNMWRQGVALGNLPDELLQYAIDDRHRIGRYVALGESGLNEAQMRGAHQVLDQRPNMSEGTFRELLDDAENVPTVKTKTDDGQQTIGDWGETVIAPMLKRAELLATVRSELSKDKRVFSRATKDAETLQTAGGTKIDTAATGQRAADASQAVAMFDTLKKVSGPVGDLLNQGTARVAQGESLTVVAKQIQREIGDSIERELANSGLKAKPDGAPLTERYRQEAMQVPGAEAKDYSPQVEGPPPPDQGQIPFSDGGQLGPLFNGPEPSRADLEAHAIQRAIANGEVRPSEMGPLELPAAPEADLDAALQELMGMDPSIPFEDQLPNMPAARQAAADELRLAAEHARRDAEMAWAAEQAAREAEGYHLKSLEQKKVDGLGQEWMEPVDVSQKLERASLYLSGDPADGIQINTENGRSLFLDHPSAGAKGSIGKSAKEEEQLARSLLEKAGVTPEEVRAYWSSKVDGLDSPGAITPSEVINPEVLPPQKAPKIADMMKAMVDEMRASDERMLRGVLEFTGSMRKGLNELEKLNDPIPDRPALIAAEVSGAPPFVFPKELNKSSPRYGRKLLQFESDLDRTAYMLFNDKAKGGSKAAEKFRQALTAAGFDPEQVAAHGKTVKAAIKAEARDTTSETVVVPVQQFGSDNPRLPLPDQQKEIGARQVQVEDIQRQINEGGCGT